MSVDGDGPATGDDDRARTTDDGGPGGDGTPWRGVPAVGGEKGEPTVRVRWSDLRAMRARIDDLEGDVDRLEAELAATRRDADAAVDRYERLLTERARDDAEPSLATDGGRAGLRSRVRAWLGL
jgi:hypothetical protein